MIVRKGKESRDGLRFSDYSLTQFLNRYDIPVKEAKKISQIDPDYFVNIFNDVVAEDDREVLIRARRGKDYGIIRAFLSEDYSILNNSRIIKTLQEQMNEGTILDIESFYMDDRRFHTRITFDPTTTAYGRDIHGADDLIKCGLDIINSETGSSSLRLEPMIYRLVCSNGLKAWRSDGEKITQRHIYVDNEELNRIMITGINNSLEKSNEIIDRFEESKSIEVGNPVKEIRRLSEIAKFSQKLTDSVEKNYYIEPMKNRFGVINAFTRGARDLKNLQRLQVEEFAGRLLLDEKLFQVA